VGTILATAYGFGAISRNARLARRDARILRPRQSEQTRQPQGASLAAPRPGTASAQVHASLVWGRVEPVTFLGVTDQA
jgi:hypothetical protein